MTTWFDIQCMAFVSIKWLQVTYRKFVANVIIVTHNCNYNESQKFVPLICVITFDQNFILA